MVNLREINRLTILISHKSRMIEIRGFIFTSQRLTKSLDANLLAQERAAAINFEKKKLIISRITHHLR